STKSTDAGGKSCYRGYTVPLSPQGIANLAAKPPWHYAGVVADAEFWTDPAAAAATLPDGLTPDPQTDGHGTVLFIDWQYSRSQDEYLAPVRSQYHEFFVLLDARWQDTPVAWCPYIYVDNDHALARGWIQGFPKSSAPFPRVANQAAPALGPGGRLAAVGTDRVEVYSKKCHYQSGRPDLNRRPLDPSHVLGVAGRGSVSLTGHLTRLDSRLA